MTEPTTTPRPLTTVNAEHATTAELIASTANGYLVLTAEAGRWIGPFAPVSRRRRRLVGRAARWCATLADHPDVVEAVVFRGALRPPGEGSDLLRAAGVRPARYDLVVLIRTSDVDALNNVRCVPAYRELVEALNAGARHTYEFAGENAARIADVDHAADHWFLFNYFHGDDAETVYRAWEYTAGWFQRNTALPNSTLIRPVPGEPADYAVVNHASWPHLRTFLPSLLFRRTFRSFVLATFRANGVAAQPILYRRVVS